MQEARHAADSRPIWRLAVFVALAVCIALPAASQKAPDSPLHGNWHGTVKDYTGGMEADQEVVVSPDTGCRWASRSQARLGRYERMNCTVGYQDKVLKLEMPRKWSLHAKLEGEMLVGVFIETSGKIEARYNITLKRGPWPQ
jgi:hypothetical protein